ncbi:MAG TPA: Gfo/Idh/MocA family oxidoreductase [Methylomirabilota bacterium]|nr:Gfo/Idh/MocA family oxidoreductase [Methylomirabilota bacterium]
MDARGVVVLGCGWIARRHAAAARGLGIPLVFASRDIGRARDYARRFRAIAAYGSYDEALRDPRASGAVVCTPHDRHLADVQRALDAGKHVLVEKPIARTLPEADAMIDAAAKAGRVLMIAEQFHFMPAFRRVRAVLEDGRLGGLRDILLVARGLHHRSGWRLDAAAAGGGALIDGGIHYVHNLRWWGGPVRRLFALRPPQTVHSLAGEDGVSLLAELAGGAVGMLANSLGSPGLPKLQWSTVTGARATCFADNRGRWVALRGDGRFRLWLFRRDTRGYGAMLRAFRDAMERGRAEEMDGVAGRADLAVVLAAYRSIAEHGPVEVAC